MFGKKKKYKRIEVKTKPSEEIIKQPEEIEEELIEEEVVEEEPKEEAEFEEEVEEIELPKRKPKTKVTKLTKKQGPELTEEVVRNVFANHEARLSNVEAALFRLKTLI